MGRLKSGGRPHAEHLVRLQARHQVPQPLMLGYLESMPRCCTYCNVILYVLTPSGGRGLGIDDTYVTIL